MESAITHALERLTGIIGARNGYWVAAERCEQETAELMRGWKVRDFLYLHDREAMLRDGIELAQRVNAGDPDPSTAAIVARSGSTRAHLRPELVDNRTWTKSWITNDYLHPRGIYDQLLSVNAASARHESYFCFTRARSDRPFGSRERDLLLLFMEWSGVFHHRVLMFRGVTGHTPLTSRERDVLPYLLIDLPETEIARLVGVGARTLHQHAVSIYRKFGCTARRALMARFLTGEIE